MEEAACNVAAGNCWKIKKNKNSGIKKWDSFLNFTLIMSYLLGKSFISVLNLTNIPQNHGIEESRIQSFYGSFGQTDIS